MDDVRTAVAAAGAMARLASLLRVAFSSLPLLTLESLLTEDFSSMPLLLLVYQYVYMFIHHA
jgi:hypothetical protein